MSDNPDAIRNTSQMAKCRKDDVFPIQAFTELDTL